jgi:hypothetical protein
VKLTLAPAVWLAHFTFVYVVASVACERLAMATTAATLAALAVYAGAALTDWRRLQAGADGTGQFVARTDLALCALSALATLWVAYPAFVLPPCAA